MRIALRRTALLSGFAALLALGACAEPRPAVVEGGTPPAPAQLPANVPPGSTLESSSTVVEDGRVVNRYVYRAPNQLLTNGPQCTKGDPQCP
ncbi:hypothetical protein KXS07_07055 [Inquilinus limosus]|uniref:hypothetical protein n=1 Tax=Inquilinus limosus TaxID=171674 RepID=UPI00047BD5B5|nr:hypothetical protein [Inquilinus limosus]